jgi:hypothetical protein
MRKSLFAVLFLCVAGFVGCSRNLSDRLVGGADSSGSNAPSGVEEAVTKGVAEMVAARVNQDSVPAAPLAVICTTGTRTATHEWVVIPPTVYAGTQTYTVNGVNYVTTYQSKSSGGRLWLATYYNGTCLTSRLYVSGELQYATTLESYASNGDAYVSEQNSTYTYWGDGIAYVVNYQWAQMTAGVFHGDYKTYKGYIKYPPAF